MNGEAVHGLVHTEVVELLIKVSQEYKRFIFIPVMFSLSHRWLIMITENIILKSFNWIQADDGAEVIVC